MITLSQFEAGNLNLNPDKNSLNPPCNSYYELDGQTISSNPYTGDCNAYAQGYCDVHLPFNCSVSRGCLFEIAATWSAAGYTYPTGCSNGTVQSNVCDERGDRQRTRVFLHRRSRDTRVPLASQCRNSGWLRSVTTIRQLHL